MRDKGQTPNYAFDYLKIGLVSTERILSWSHGEVEKPETINYRTFKPERKGLFDEKIFGPVKDWECHCGRYKRVRYRGIICERCGVEVTTSRVRRERMGHLRLCVPVSHVWFLRGTPGYVGLILDLNNKSLEEVIYYDAHIVTEVSDSLKDEVKIGQVLKEGDYQDLKEKYGNAFKADTGARPIRELLSRIDLPPLAKGLRKEFKNSVGQKRIKIIKRLRVIEAFLESGNRPEWMILEVVPVMPPDLRPMVQLEGGRFATSDLNDLYRRVINRNNRLKKMIGMGAPEMIIRNEKRMLQESVDVLIDNGRRKKVVTGSTGRPLKSLTDIIEGKQGRFRQNLLGKRTDYSGRSVIVVGPTLKLHQCGLPKEMALELFKPFVIRKLVEKGLSQNVKSAKRQLERKDVIVWDILEEVIDGQVVLLNRAPTLHRLSIQAFEPVLVEGKAIQIHPLVCTAFNADFDGDQMAVHVPLLIEAQVEARVLMLSANNLLSPASGRPVVTPTQDIILGTYYMTYMDENQDLGRGFIFSDEDEAMFAHDNNGVHLHAKIKARINNELIETTVGRIKFNHTIRRAIKRVLPDIEIEYKNYVFSKEKVEELVKDFYMKFGNNVTASVVDEIKRLGFKYATLAGISIAIDDLIIPKSKKSTVERAEKEIEHLEKLEKNGSISTKEKFIKSLDVWSKVTIDVTQALLQEFDKLNSVYLMAFSGARGSMQQVRQLSGIRGLMADPSGNIIEIPIKTNFKEGLNVTEYFISSYGARKGLVDTALRTADSGYLTRRLVDVAQDVLIIDKDCGTKHGIVLSTIWEGYEEVVPLKARIVGRTSVAKVSDPISGKTIAAAGEEIDAEKAQKIVSAGIESVEVKSPLTCKIKKGICQSCYGKNLATGDLINIGEAVGIIAAQSIGEPGTQLTMRTFHIGGIALHKTAKVEIKAKHPGKVKFGEDLEVKTTKDDYDNKIKLVTRESKVSVKIKEREEIYPIPVGSVMKVADGDHIDAQKVIAEYDPAYDYFIATSEGRIKMIDLETFERKKKIGDTTIIETLAKNDGMVFIYNPKMLKEYEIPKGVKPFVKLGNSVKLGEELAPSHAAKAPGTVIELEESSRHTKIVTSMGEFYQIPSGSHMIVKEGDDIGSYEVIAKVESVQRDSSKTRDIIQGLPRVEELFEARRPKDPVLLAEIDGEIEIIDKEGVRQLSVIGAKNERRDYLLSYDTRIRVAKGDKVHKGSHLTYGTVNIHDLLTILGVEEAQRFLVNEIQKIYRSQGVTIHDKHIETSIRQMTKKVRVVTPGDSMLLPGELIDKYDFDKLCEEIKGEKPTAAQVLLGITKASLITGSFISAASFQETARILTDAAVKGKTDEMYGLKENVIIGKIIPAGTGFEGYRYLEVNPA